MAYICKQHASPCMDNAGGAEAGPGGSAGAPGSSSAREVKLAKLVETLKGRLEVLRGENKQLEELLQAADNRASGALPHSPPGWFH